MSCAMEEEVLALFLSDDLDAEQSGTVLEHVNECEACRQRLAELQLSQQLLANSFEEPTEEDLRTVRIAVKSRLALHSRRSAWPFAAAAAFGLAVLLAPVLVHHKAEEQSHSGAAVRRLEVAVATQPPRTLPNLRAFRQVRRRVQRHVQEAGLRSAVLSTNVSGKPELRMVTADPDVVILLQMDGDTHAN